MHLFNSRNLTLVKQSSLVKMSGKFTTLINVVLVVRGRYGGIRQKVYYIGVIKLLLNLIQFFCTLCLWKYIDTNNILERKELECPCIIGLHDIVKQKEENMQIMCIHLAKNDCY